MNCYYANLFDKRKDDPRYNTSYPLLPSHWARYRAEGPLPFDGEEELSLYIHIPFCQQLCSFCEYTRMVCPSAGLQLGYVGTVARDVARFVRQHPGVRLLGFDIGGGTPTALQPEAFSQLMDAFASAAGSLPLADDFEPSIEATFATVTRAKAAAIAAAGIRRVSLGVQSASSAVLSENHRRNADVGHMQAVMAMLHTEGIAKVNLDMMYGLKGQSLDSLGQDLRVIGLLNPEQVTLYELRTNMIAERSHMSKAQLLEAYATLHQGLTAMGYHARFGENTFSKSAADKGVSSYLRSRMLYGASYKGFGIAAQSMSREGLAYNVGKSQRGLRSLLGRDTFAEEFTYMLPPAERAAKYIAIGAYNGSFSLRRLSAILGTDGARHYRGQLDFCLANGLLTLDPDGDRVAITRKGFGHYGAVFSLFYAPWARGGARQESAEA